MIPVGRIIDGRYVVEGELGSGGMGVVLKVRHRFTGAMHALKMLRPDYATDVDVQNRFLAEARAATQIGHAGIVAVQDAGKTPEGELYLVMELLTGQPLRSALLRGGMAPPELRRIGTELLDALGAAHARGFVHRDLKPENVFLCAPNGTIKLLDFGIAKIAKAANVTAMPQTAAGIVLGTLAYMAPEQLHDARSVDTRADLWAIGVMFYEILTGRLPWRATTMAELFIMLESEQPTPIQTFLPGAPPQVIAFFARALSRDPNARFQSTREMSAALAQLPTGNAPAKPGLMQTQMTGGAWQGVAGTRATPAAGITQATGYPSMAPPPAVAAPTAAPQPHGRKRWIALGLGVVALGFIVTAVAIAKRDGGGVATVDESKPVPEKKIVADRGENIPLPPQVAPPQPPPVDAGVAPVPKKIVKPGAGSSTMARP